MKTEINQKNNSLENIYSYQKPHLEVKITKESDDLKQARQLREHYYKSFQPRVFSTQDEKLNNTYTRIPLEHKSVIYDGYDSFSEHLIIIDHKKDKVVAYVRLIDAQVAFKIGGYYSETQFNLNKLFNHNAHYLEMSRMVIDPEYNCRETAQFLWTALTNYAKTNGVDSLIGTFTLPMTMPNETYSFIQNLKDKHISNHQHRVSPYKLFPFTKRENNTNFTDPLVEYFFEKGSKLCGDAHWNQDSNCAEIFIHYPLCKKLEQPYYIDTDEADSGSDYIN